jgi:ketosteroid isomerase-like protein
MSPEQSVAAANQRFYDAFEARDLDAMAAVWERSDRATVTHPGWPTLRGWAKVAGSWDAIFKGTPYIQFILTDTHVNVAGDLAWVSLNENILQGEGADSTVAALNVFAQREGDWRMVVHHGSPVAAS